MLVSAATADAVNAAARIDAHATHVANLALFMVPPFARVATSKSEASKITLPNAFRTSISVRSDAGPATAYRDVLYDYDCARRASAAASMALKRG